MEDILFTAVALLAGMLVHQLVLRRHPLAFEQKLLTRSFVLHMVSAFALFGVYKTYYGGGGDMFSYELFGVPITEALRGDFERVAPELWALFVHGDYTLPLDVYGLGSTGTMQAIACALFFVLGNSVLASAVVISIGSYLAKVLIYWAFKPEFNGEHHERVLFALMLSPTGIVWTCALLKEPVLMVFLGPAFVSLRWLTDGRRLPLAALLLVACGWIIALLKPYVLIAFGVGAAGWFVSRTISNQGNLLVKPMYLVVATTILVLGFSVASTFVPGLSPDQVGESIQYQRRVSARETGGSNFYLEDADAPIDAAPEQRSLLSQLRLVPLALITSFFRPVLFESFSALQFLNSIEMAWLTWLFVQVIRRNKWAALVGRVTNNPALVFSTGFSLVLALGTGLSTANLGTLSRYRAPMMPFFLLLLMVLREVPQLARPQLAADRRLLVL